MGLSITIQFKLAGQRISGYFVDIEVVFVCWEKTIRLAKYSFAVTHQMLYLYKGGFNSEKRFENGKPSDCSLQPSKVHSKEGPGAEETRA